MEDGPRCVVPYVHSKTCITRRADNCPTPATFVSNWIDVLIRFEPPLVMQASRVDDIDKRARFTFGCEGPNPHAFVLALHVHHVEYLANLGFRSVSDAPLGLAVDHH